MINIVFGLYDKDGEYSKNIAAAIFYLLENTREELIIYILHNENLPLKIKKYLEKIICSYGQTCVFKSIDITNQTFANQDFSIISVGTLYRLKIADIMPTSVDKIIYLDSDIIFNMDIMALWHEFGNMNTTIAGKKDDIGGATYINAGVLLLNLNKMRLKYKFYEEATQYFRENPYSKHTDQDAINHIFTNDKSFLVERYNIFTIYDRKNRKYNKGIFHFAGDYPKIQSDYLADRLYWNYIKNSPWKAEYTRLTNFINNITQYKILLFGSSGIQHDNIVQFIQKKHGNIVGYLDNNKALWGKKKNGHLVMAPTEYRKLNQEEYKIVVVSGHHNEIKEQLLSYGCQENIHFFKGRYFC